MAFESGVVPEDWRSEYSNYRGSLLSMFGKTYAGILIDRVCKVRGFD